MEAEPANVLVQTEATMIHSPENQFIFLGCEIRRQTRDQGGREVTLHHRNNIWDFKY